jgi:predicted nucleic acid-binding Zn ribbon protein
VNSLKAVLQRILKSNPTLEGGLRDARMLEIWPEAVGPLIAKHTRAAFLKQKKVFVEVDNPIWKQELFTNKRMALKKYNELLQKELGPSPTGDWVEDLFFL